MTPDDLLTLIYTSGEAGPLKGVQLTRGDVTARVASLRERLRLRDGWRAISWLPMAHIAERLCAHYLPLVHGWQITTCADPCGVTALLADIRPELLFAPPTRWKDLRASVLARFDGDAELAAMDTDAVLAGLGLEQLRAAILGPASCRPEVVAFWHTRWAFRSARSADYRRAPAQAASTQHRR